MPVTSLCRLQADGVLDFLSDKLITFSSMPVKKIILYQSESHKGIAQYKILHEWTC